MILKCRLIQGRFIRQLKGGGKSVSEITGNGEQRETRNK